MQDSVNLKPCPFCGGEAELFVREFTDAEANFGNATVDCSECGCGFGYCCTEAEAITAWNTRLSAPSHEVVEVLREVADAANDMIVALNDGTTPILTPERYNSAGQRLQVARDRIDALLTKLGAA